MGWIERRVEYCSLSIRSEHRSRLPTGRLGGRALCSQPTWQTGGVESRGAAVTRPVLEELGGAQLRDQVERAWNEVSDFIDRIIGSGRMLDRETLLDLARFLESAMPAVDAYERLVARAYEDAIAEAGTTVLPLRTVGRDIRPSGGE